MSSVNNSVSSVSSSFLQRAINLIDIIAVEGYATLRHVLPASLKWIWRKYITHEIKTIPIQITAGKVSKVAYLNIHGICREQKSPSVLLTHGDYGHPFSMLHLADIAQKNKQSVFSLYIPGVQNDDQLEIHQSLLKQSIDKIESMMKANQKEFAGILGVGHSKGAILLAERQFLSLDSRMTAMCSIAGRLNIIDEQDCSHQNLKTTIKNIYQAVVRNPQLPITQIIPKDDWNAPYEAMAVRPLENCYSVPGQHLSGLYSKETLTHVTTFCKKVCE